MESKKINQLATELTPALDDLTIIGDPTTGVSKKITLSQMASLFTGTVEEYANVAAFPLVGVADTIYIALDTNVLYRWNTGTSAYVELSPNIINSLVFSDANGFDGNISLVGSVATLTITTALTTGSVPFIGASGALSQDNANLFFDDTNNRLGINTNAPTTALDVFGSSIIGRLNGTSTNNAYLGFASAGTNKWSIGNVQADHRFRIYNEATTSELVSVLSTGEFGIGIANPTTKFHIDGAATALIANLDANVSVAKSLSFRSDNSNRINLEVSGTESGSNAGMDFFLRTYTDLGALIETPFSIVRSTGITTIKSLTLTNALSIANGGTGSTTQNFVDLTTAQTIAGAKTFSSITTVSNSTTSSSTTTGALVVTGGIGIGGALFGTSATFSGAMVVGGSSTAQQFSVFGANDPRAEVVSTANNSAGTYFRVMNGATMTGNATMRVTNTGLFELYTGGASDALRLTIASNGAATFSNALTVTENIAAGNQISTTIADISTGDNRGFRLFNSNGNKAWNITAGRTGQNNSDFVVRDSTRSVNAIVLDSASGDMTILRNLTMNGTLNNAGNLQDQFTKSVPSGGVFNLFSVNFNGVAFGGTIEFTFAFIAVGNAYYGGTWVYDIYSVSGVVNYNLRSSYGSGIVQAPSVSGGTITFSVSTAASSTLGPVNVRIIGCSNSNGNNNGYTYTRL
jgi:hypothetical protein